jgi:hypothetical protein
MGLHFETEPNTDNAAMLKPTATLLCASSPLSGLAEKSKLSFPIKLGSLVVEQGA